MREDNPAVYVPLQLQEVEKKFRELLDKSEKCLANICRKSRDEIWKKNLTKSKVDLFIDSLGVKSGYTFSTYHDFTHNNRLDNHTFNYNMVIS